MNVYCVEDMQPECQVPMNQSSVQQLQLNQPEIIFRKNFPNTLLCNLHQYMPPPPATNVRNGITFLTRGDFKYFHYNCDGYQDAGWGCAYRTLQSTCSWILGNLSKSSDMSYNNSMVEQEVPSIPEIQQILVNIGDKPAEFVGSKEWIGALEVFYVIDNLYEVPCKILHVPQREDLKKYANVLKKYFEDFGGLVMIGGDLDASSKGIAGIHISGNQAFFLIIDPHFVGKPKSVQELIERGYIRWQHTSEFVESSFYNLCLPQMK